MNVFLFFLFVCFFCLVFLVMLFKNNNKKRKLFPFYIFHDNNIGYLTSFPFPYHIFNSTKTLQDLIITNCFYWFVVVVVVVCGFPGSLLPLLGAAYLQVAIYWSKWSRICFHMFHKYLVRSDEWNSAAWMVNSLIIAQFQKIILFKKKKKKAVTIVCIVAVQFKDVY